MPPKGIEIVQRSRPRENSASKEFAETREVSRRSPRELKFVRDIIRLEDLTKSFINKSRAYVMSGGVPTRLHAQYLPQGNEKLLMRDILFLKRRSVYLRQHFTLTESHEANFTMELPSK